MTGHFFSAFAGPFMILRALRRAIWVSRRLHRGAVSLAVLCFAEGQEVDDSYSQAVCFPPTVPVYGEAIRELPTPRRGLIVPAPVELAHFVNEPFYPAYSTRLLSSGVGGRFQSRIDAYRERRSALINELADQLAALHGADEATRQTTLRAFSVRQTPQIVRLEQEAETLRRELIQGNLVRLSGDWSRKRRWTLGVTRFGNDAHEKQAHFLVTRATAFYQDGLSVAQRGLLREVASDLWRESLATRAVPVPHPDDASAMFFSPETSRLRLPPHLPAELVGKIGRFNREKALLQRELRDAVFDYDKVGPDARTRAFTELADRQHPRLIELEILAEQIRIELVKVPPRRLAAPPHIPPGVLTRMRNYERERQRLYREYIDAMGAASAQVKPPKFKPRLSREERQRLAREYERERAAHRVRASQAFMDAANEQIESMRREYDELQTDLRLVAAGQFDPETGRPLDPETLVRSYSTAIERFETFGREEVIYRGYRTAMLMPGLSPEQRRLLFGAAIVGLAQPLPFGESFPAEYRQPRS